MPVAKGNERPRLILVDDHRMVAESLAASLSRTCEIVAVASGAGDFRSLSISGDSVEPRAPAAHGGHDSVCGSFRGSSSARLGVARRDYPVITANETAVPANAGETPGS